MTKTYPHQVIMNLVNISIAIINDICLNYFFKNVFHSNILYISD